MGYLFGGPHIKDSILGSILGSPYAYTYKYVFIYNYILFRGPPGFGSMSVLATKKLRDIEKMPCGEDIIVGSPMHLKKEYPRAT